LKLLRLTRSAVEATAEYHGTLERKQRANILNKSIERERLNFPLRPCFTVILTFKQVLEYCLFQPGLFTNYFSWPHVSTKYLSTPQLHIDFENRRAIVVEGGDPQLTLTTVQDLAKVVAAAIDYEGEWPETGGVRGGQITIPKLLQLGAELRGKVALWISPRKLLKIGY